MKRSAGTAIIAGMIFPLHESLKGHDTVARSRALEQSQWWTPSAIAEHQVGRLRSFLSEIGARVPFYRRLFAELQFDPMQVTAVSDLAALPLLTKTIIRSNLTELTSDAAIGLKRFNTGGSSGEPLIFFVGSKRRSHDIAAKWRATRWWDVDIGDREVVLWGSPVELSAQDWLRKARDGLLRTHLISAFEMSPTLLDSFVARIRALRPRMLFGYPSALAHVARHAQAKGQRMDDLGIRVAFVTSERLYDDQRTTISRVFGCPVANGYGSRDAGFIAHECPSGGMHISAEDIVIEIVDGAGRRLPPGQQGEIVVTHLATADFPFVRYRTGDVASLDPSPCRCGRGLPLLADIQGRSTDFVTAADGTVMHGLSLIYSVRDVPGIEQFRIVQHDLLHTEVELVTNESFAVEAERRIVDGFKARLGHAVDVRVTHVPVIARERSGKYRYVVSHVTAGVARAPEASEAAGP